MVAMQRFRRTVFQSVRRRMTDDPLAAYERVVLAYQDRLYRFALRMCGNAADAREITQEAFIRGYRALQRFRPSGGARLALQAWLYRITLTSRATTCAGAGRRACPGQPHGHEPRATETPASVLLGRERRRVLAALVAGLPERYRAPVRLRHVEALSYEDTAAVLRQPRGTTKANVHRAAALLRRAIEERR